MKAFLLFLVILMCPNLLKSQWEKTNGPERASMVWGYAFKDSITFAAISVAGYGINAYGMVYRSHNKGDNWEAASSGLPVSASFFVTSLAASSPYIFAGTNRGVWRSADNGDHWISVTHGMTDTLVAFMGAANGHVFAFTTNSVYKSDDFGTSWVNCFNGSSSMHDYSGFAQIGSTLFFSDSYTGIWRSQNNGTSWANVHVNSIYSNTIAALGPSLFAYGFPGLIRSDDNGTTWSVINDTLLVWRMVTEGSSIYTGGYGYFYRSDDNGNSWTSITNGIPVEYILSMGADNSSVYVGNYTGTFRTDNAGLKWMKKVNGLPFDRVTSITTKWTNIYAGTNGGGVFHSTDLGSNWTEINTLLSCADVNSLAMDGYELYCGTSNGVFISNTGGEHWVAYNNGLTVKIINMILPDSGKLYSCTEGGGVFFSTDDGMTWIPRNMGLSNLNVRCICKTGSSVLCGTHGGGIFRSFNQGNTWISSNPGLTNSNINTILSHGNRIFAGTDNGVFLSDDNGFSWASSNSGLFNTAINSFTSVDNLVFAGTDKGIYRYSENESMWINVSEMLPDTVVTALAASKTDLYAGILGSGVWTRPLSDFSILGVAPASLTLAESANDMDTITITASDDWALQGTVPDWLAVDKWNGSGNDILVFRTLQENPEGQIRSAGFYINSHAGLSVAFTVIQKRKTSGTGDLSHVSLRIYPVPSSDVIHIESNFSMEEIIIFDTDGKQIRQQQPRENIADVDLSAERKGVYFIRILYTNGVITRKIVLQ